MKVAIFGSTYKEENLILLETLIGLVKKRKAAVCMEREFHDFAKSRVEFASEVDELIVDDAFEADMAVSIGGDGTFLRTAALVGNKGIPIIGINTGRLGFLADIASTDIVEPFERILDKEYIIEERTLLQLNYRGEMPTDYNKGLNEIAVMKQDSSSMITIDAYVDGMHLISYQSDGLIVATPTGSTAYSMSVGGPLVIPQANNIILTPIASHSLTVRPLVITDNSTISLKVSSRTNSYLVSVDGRSKVLSGDVNLDIKKADYTIKVIKQQNHAFINTLKEKLMWGADKRK